ncbi:MAG: DUF1800 domain-containing protein, partial [Myxococcota bacterium]
MRLAVPASRRVRIASMAVCLALGASTSAAQPPRRNDLKPLPAEEWNRATAAHLLERAGFGASPSEVDRWTSMGLRRAVARLVRFRGSPKDDLPPFDHSGIHDPGIEPFPPSRPAATRLAAERGHAIGVSVKPTGNRRLQPVVNRFFYWLRASYLETDRLAYWWADRMLRSSRPLQEKMALFWHGHFSVNESKVRDYRKHLQLLRTFHRHGLGQFRELVVGVAQSPAMLAFLDAGVNTKGSPNENFAREIMELFVLGVGHYREEDIREAARAFTGWNYKDLTFVLNAEHHDSGSKTILGRTGAMDGVQVIDLLLEQPAAARFLVTKIYSEFVRAHPSPEVIEALAATFRESGYDIARLMETLFLSRDFYAPESMGTHIKGPVELAVSTYRKLELDRVPGHPDFNASTTVLGQRLFHPPTVAGWDGGRAWITPGLLIGRANFAYELLYPDIDFVPHDRKPPPRYAHISRVGQRLADGADISAATQASTDGGEAAMSNKMVDADEDFNTRYGSYRGWQLAIQKVKPIPRETAALDLAGLVDRAKLSTADEVVDHFLNRMLAVPATTAQRRQLTTSLVNEMGTDRVADAR